MRTVFGIMAALTLGGGLLYYGIWHSKEFEGDRYVQPSYLIPEFYVYDRGLVVTFSIFTFLCLETILTNQWGVLKGALRAAMTAENGDPIWATTSHSSTLCSTLAG